MEATISGLTITSAVSESDREILTHEACAFLADLVEKFSPQRDKLLTAREKWQAEIDAGGLPQFRPETENVRSGDWKIAPLPEKLLDRRVEITGPVTRKMMINALNADVKVFMADFEDALSPTWKNVIDGQKNMRDAAHGEMTHTDENSGKHYQLGDDPAVLIARVRGLHLDEKNILYNGKPIPGCLADFALYFYHNQKILCDRGAGPYFYVPKLEHYEEARWWNEVFVEAQTKLGVPIGTIKATMLIETLPAVFEMHELLYEMKDHAAALNCGRWDYIFSYIKTFKNHADRILPDRHSVGMDKPFLDAYSKLLVDTCHQRGALAMGGMSAFLPAKSPEEDAANKEKVRADKQREADNGHDGSWIAHPALSDVVNTVYSASFSADKTNQLEKGIGLGASIDADNLIEAPNGDFTEDGLRNNIRVALQYIEAWLNGLGAVAIYGLMEDAATAEISRASIWQWIRHGVVLSNGQKMTVDYYKKIASEEFDVVKEEVGAQRWNTGRFEEAIDILNQLCTSEDFDTFLTLSAYRKIN